MSAHFLSILPSYSLINNTKTLLTMSAHPKASNGNAFAQADASSRPGSLPPNRVKISAHMSAHLQRQTSKKWCNNIV